VTAIVPFNVQPMIIDSTQSGIPSTTAMSGQVVYVICCYSGPWQVSTNRQKRSLLRVRSHHCNARPPFIPLKHIVAFTSSESDPPHKVLSGICYRKDLGTNRRVRLADNDVGLHHEQSSPSDVFARFDASADERGRIVRMAQVSTMAGRLFADLAHQ